MLFIPTIAFFSMLHHTASFHVIDNNYFLHITTELHFCAHDEVSLCGTGISFSEKAG